MRSPPHSNCLANCRSRTASSRSTPCTAKKNLRSRRTGARTRPRPTEGQSAQPAAKCRSRLCLAPTRQQRHHRYHRAQPTGDQDGRGIRCNPRRCRNRVAAPDQAGRPRHPRCPASRYQDRLVEQFLRGRLLRRQLRRLGAPCRRGDPMPLTHREPAALHPRRHLPGRPIAHPSQSWCLRQAALLCLQHLASKPDLNVQSGSIRRSPRRGRRPAQLEIQLRALNSPG